MRSEDNRALKERGSTLRRLILECLEAGPVTARELSARVHIRERDVIPHLEHLERTLRRSGHRLAIEPAVCVACGFRFEKRRRFSRPSACPRCRSQRIEPPSFWVRPPPGPSQ